MCLSLEILDSKNKEIKEGLVIFEKHVLLSVHKQWESKREIKLNRLIKIQKSYAFGKKC